MKPATEAAPGPASDKGARELSERRAQAALATVPWPPLVARPEGRAPVCRQLDEGGNTPRAPEGLALAG